MFSVWLRRTLPLVGFKAPVNSFIKVLLPHPLSPRSHTRSPLYKDMLNGERCHNGSRPGYPNVTSVVSTNSLLAGMVGLPMSSFISGSLCSSVCAALRSCFMAASFSCCILLSLDAEASDLSRMLPMAIRATHFFALSFSPLDACFCWRSMARCADISAFFSSFCRFCRRAALAAFSASTVSLYML